MKKQLRILLAGAMVILPLGLTVYAIWWAGGALDALGQRLLTANQKDPSPIPPGVGAGVIVVGIYLVGLATHFWLFRLVLGWLERIVARLPGIKTVYESIRDLMKLFGGGSEGLGKAVQYRVPGTDIAVLGIMTNENPAGSEEGKVAVFLPFSYMFGGPTIYVSRDQVDELQMSVDQVLKICTTAHTGTETLRKKLNAQAQKA